MLFITQNFGRRLKPLGVTVREFTGDMQLSKSELDNTQILITTPEKWDVVTRKSGEVCIAIRKPSLMFHVAAT